MAVADLHALKGPSRDLDAPAEWMTMLKAAHDIRTPLAAVVQGVDALLYLAQEVDSSDRTLRMFSLVRRNLLFMVEVLEATERRGPVKDHAIDLFELACSTRELIQPLLAARGQDVVIGGHRAVTVRGDYGGLARAMLNLLDNASKFGPRGDTIRVLLRRRANDVLVSVCDHGPGIPRAQRQAIFGAFYRANASDDAPDGLGLGLAVVRDVVDSHGGAVHVSCTQGETRISFSIPCESDD